MGAATAWVLIPPNSTELESGAALRPTISCAVDSAFARVPAGSAGFCEAWCAACSAWRSPGESFGSVSAAMIGLAFGAAAVGPAGGMSLAKPSANSTRDMACSRWEALVDLLCAVARSFSRDFVSPPASRTCCSRPPVRMASVIWVTRSEMGSTAGAAVLDASSVAAFISLR